MRHLEFYYYNAFVIIPDRMPCMLIGLYCVDSLIFFILRRACIGIFTFFLALSRRLDFALIRFSTLIRLLPCRGLPPLDKYVSALDKPISLLDKPVPPLDKPVLPLDELRPPLDELGPSLDELILPLDELVPSLDEPVPSRPL